MHTSQQRLVSCCTTNVFQLQSVSYFMDMVFPQHFVISCDFRCSYKRGATGSHSYETTGRMVFLYVYVHVYGNNIFITSVLRLSTNRTFYLCSIHLLIPLRNSSHYCSYICSLSFFSSSYILCLYRRAFCTINRILIKQMKFQLSFMLSRRCICSMRLKMKFA